MKLMFWSKKKRERELERKQDAATAVHQQNISNIVQSREPAYRLKEALEQNQIVIQIAGAVGHH
jgi:ribosome maturation protein Sdo1